MAVTANSIITPQTPLSRTAVATAAEVAFSAPTTAQDLLLPADNVSGARISKLYAIPRAATGAVINCQLYKKVGTTYTLLDSVLTANVTPSATVANPKYDFGLSDDNPMVLFAGEGLAVAIGSAVANGVVFRCEGGLY
jgi:hypothetical protein